MRPERLNALDPMLLDSLLAYAHISAILLLAVFLTSETALMRPEVIDGRKAALLRLQSLDLWLWASLVAVLATGLTWMLWGAKGWAWDVANPLLWAKLALFLVIAGMAVPPRRALRGWLVTHALTGQFPATEAIRRQRRWLMWQAHILVLVPLLGTLLTHGY
jgi:putative membrane protein